MLEDEEDMLDLHLVELLAKGFGAEDIAQILGNEGWWGNAEDVRDRIRWLREEGLLQEIEWGAA